MTNPTWTQSEKLGLATYPHPEQKRMGLDLSELMRLTLFSGPNRWAAMQWKFLDLTSSRPQWDIKCKSETEDNWDTLAKW